MRLLTFTLACVIPPTLSLHILMYLNLVGKSHLQHGEKLIEALNENGHKVDLIIGHMNTEVRIKGTYGAQKLIVTGFPGTSPWNEAATHLKDPFERDVSLNPFADPFYMFVDVVDEMCDLMLNNGEIHSLLRNTKYDLVMSSAYEECPFALYHYYKQGPVVTFAATPAVLQQTLYGGLPELPIYENCLLHAREEGSRADFSARLFDTLFLLVNRHRHNRHIEKLNTKLRSFFGSDFADIRDILKNNSLDITNSHPLLEEPRPISYRIRYTGGVGLPKPKLLSKELNAMLNISKAGTVIFSFGTQVPASKFSPRMVDTFIEAFKRFPEYSFLWKFDGVTKFNATNVFNMEWLPQTDLLYDDRVVGFISHMGLNSFLETSHAGVPIISIPLFADQMHNAKRAEKLGTGLVIRKDRVTVDSLTAALNAVLREKSYRQNARQLAEMMAEMPDQSRRVFIESIEFAAKFKSLPEHYRLEGANYNFFVHHGWDIAAFLFTVAATSTALISYLTYSILSRVVTIRIKTKAD